MAGEAVDGRFGAARHAVADDPEGRGPERAEHPVADDRSLVDRLLAADERVFDWGWGDPAAAAADRQPPHDIPELWAPSERAAAADRDTAGGDVDDAVRTVPEGAVLVTDGLRAGAGDDAGHGASHDQADLVADQEAPAAELRPHASIFDDLVAGSTGAEPGPGPDERDLPDPQHAGADEPEALDGAPLDGAPLDSAPLDSAPLDSAPFDDAPFSAPFDGDPFDLGPLDRDTFGGGPSDRDPTDRTSAAPLNGHAIDREPPADQTAEQTADRAAGRPGGDPLDDDRREERPAGHDAYGGDPRYAGLLGAGAAEQDASDGVPHTSDLPGGVPVEAGASDRDRHEADRPGGGPPDHGRFEDPRGAGAPADRGLFDGDGLDADRIGTATAEQGPFDRDPHDADPLAAGPFGPGRAVGGSAGRGRPFDRAPFDARSLDGGTADGGRFEEPPADIAPDPTTVLEVVPAGGRRPLHPAATATTPAAQHARRMEELAARRRFSEQAAAEAEAAAAAAAERASAAIAAAARAADEAEAAAEEAARAAEDAHAAAAAEARAAADVTARTAADAALRSAAGGGGLDDGPAQPDGPDGPHGGDRPPGSDSPTQLVPLIAPVNAPGRRPPPVRPAGPLPRDMRLDDAGRPGPPRGRAAHRAGTPRQGADSETTAVLTGLHALRAPDRPRSPEPPPLDATTISPPLLTGPDTGTGSGAGVDTGIDTAGADEPGDEEGTGPRPGLGSRLPRRPVLAGVAVAGALAITAVVATMTATAPDPAPAAVTSPVVPAPVAAQPGPPPPPAIDLESDEALEYLTALRDADIPTSRSGQAETEAAAAICSQLDQGADEAQLVRSVPAVLPDVDRAQAADVVDLAQQHYCS